MSHLRMILGEFDQVAAQAKRYSSVRTWRRGQAAQAAAAMTVATAPPFILALPASVAASVFAVRKLAHAGWGLPVVAGGAAYLAVRSFSMRAEEFYARRA